MASVCDEANLKRIGLICFLATQAGFRWDENGKRAYIVDERADGGIVTEVPNPIDFQGSYDDFHCMLSTTILTRFDATCAFRKLHAPTLRISSNRIQFSSVVGEDKAMETFLVVNNVPEIFNSVCFVRHFIGFVFDSDHLNDGKCTVDRLHSRVIVSWDHRKVSCAAALMWWTSFVAGRLDSTKGSWLHAGKQQSTVLTARTETKVVDISACSECSSMVHHEAMQHEPCGDDSTMSHKSTMPMPGTERNQRPSRFYPESFCFVYLQHFRFYPARPCRELRLLLQAFSRRSI